MKSTKNTKNTKNKSLETLINKGFSLFLLVFFVVLAHPSTTAVCCSWWCQNSKHQEHQEQLFHQFLHVRKTTKNINKLMPFIQLMM